jgi:quercetin dioxygenase-like cupin family protein
MQTKLKALAIALSLCGVFVAGVAVGKGDAKQAKFISRDEVKVAELAPGFKVGLVTGDKDKGPHVSMIQLAAGFESPWHSHTGDYEAIQVSGTSKHWFKGEDSAKAKKLTPGSYWTIPGGVDHVSACEKGADCVMIVWQKTKFDSIPGKDAAKPAMPATPATPAKPAAPAAPK